MVSYHGYKRAVLCRARAESAIVPWKSGMNTYNLGGKSMDLIKELNKETLQNEVPSVQIGDTVRVKYMGIDKKGRQDFSMKDAE